MGDNYCRVWEDYYGTIDDESLESSIFSIHVRASFTYPTREEEEDEDEIDYINSLETGYLERTHKLQLDEIERDPRSAIHNMLASMHVPVEDFMIDTISDYVMGMLSNPCRRRKVLRARVDVDVVVARSPFAVENPNTVPASKEAVESLEEVEVEDQVVCAICLDGFSVGSGSKAKRMPCTHVFHPDCIVNWLGRSKLCPTCRYQLPDEIMFLH